MSSHAERSDGGLEVLEPERFGRIAERVQLALVLFFVLRFTAFYLWPGMRGNSPLLGLLAVESSWLLWVLLTPRILRWGLHRPSAPPRWLRRAGYHLRRLVPLSLGMFSYRALMSELAGMEGPFSPFEAAAAIVPFSLMTESLLYLSLVAVAHSLARWHEIEREEAAAQALRREVAEAQGWVLRAKVDPGRLGGALDHLAALAVAEPERALSELTRLGDLLRRLLDGDLRGPVHSDPAAIDELERFATSLVEDGAVASAGRAG